MKQQYCQICRRSMGANYYVLHLKKFHTKTKKPPKKDCVECHYCGKIMLVARLPRHVTTCRGVIKKTDLRKRFVKQRQQQLMAKRSSPDKIQCQICRKPVKLKGMLKHMTRAHQAEKNVEKRWQCPHCTTIINKSWIALHLNNCSVFKTKISADSFGKSLEILSLEILEKQRQEKSIKKEAKRKVYNALKNVMALKSEQKDV